MLLCCVVAIGGYRWIIHSYQVCNIKLITQYVSRLYIQDIVQVGRRTYSYVNKVNFNNVWRMLNSRSEITITFCCDFTFVITYLLFTTFLYLYISTHQLQMVSLIYVNHSIVGSIIRTTKFCISIVCTHLDATWLVFNQL